MNIGIFTDCYLPTKNGVTTVIVQAKHELERRGHKVVVLTVSYPACAPMPSWNRGFSRSGGGCERPAKASIPHPVDRIYRFPSLPFRPDIELRLSLPRQAEIDRLVAREQIDLIHTHTEFSLGWAGRCAARRAGLPLIHTLHTFYPAYRHYLPLGRLLPQRAITGLLARFLAPCDVVVCPSEKGRGYVASILPAARTAVIPNGVAAARFDLGRFSEADRGRARAALGIGPAERVILYAGRLAAEKRVLALFAALRPLLAAHPDCRAVFVGAGPARDKIAAAARVAGLARQTFLTGPIPWERMTEIYAIADVFVTASLSEIHPMTVIEAALCGLPVVARRDAGLAGLVFDGSNGFLVDSDVELAGRLAAILDDAAARRMFGENARALAQRFTVEAHVDRLEALYQQIIHHRKGGFGPVNARSPC